MRKTILATSVATLLALPMAGAIAADPTPEHTFTGNVGFASEYLYRGIAQTTGKPALQGGFDYSHSSGLYAGVWGSNINWLSNNNASTASLEIDVYGGYKGTITGDFGFDVGVLTYNYPGKLLAATSPNTTELYGALTWKFLTVKYSNSTTNLFGNPNSKNSSYLELNAGYDLGGGWGINGHVGHQKVKNVANADYTDYKLGVTKDVGFGVIGLALSTTNAQDDCGTVPVQFYCLNSAPTTTDYSYGKSRAVVTFTKSF